MRTELRFNLEDREVTGRRGFYEKARFSKIEKALLNGKPLRKLSWAGIVREVYSTVYVAVGRDEKEANRVCPVWVGQAIRDGKVRLSWPGVTAENALRFIAGAFQSEDSIVQDTLKSIRIEVGWKPEEKRAAHPGCGAVFEYERGHHETENAEPFELYDESARLETVTRIERDPAFSKDVIMAYGRKCAFCQGGRRHDKATELEAAHIVPREKRGPDDIRNGLALCRSCHWAFDNGLMTVGENGAIMVLLGVGKHHENASLMALDGKMVSQPRVKHARPHPDALRWHRENTFGRTSSPLVP